MIHFRRDSTHCASERPELLQSFLDGELPEARRTALTAHLERCPRCAAALERLSEGDRLLVSARPTPPPMSPAASRLLLDRALAEAGILQGNRRSLWLPLVWGFVAMLVALASGVGVARWHWMGSPRNPGARREWAAITPPGQRSAPGVEIASETGPRMPKTVETAPRPSMASKRAHPLKKRLPVKDPEGTATPSFRTGPRPGAPTRHMIPHPHRLIAERRPRDEAPAGQPGIADRIPAPGTGEQVAANTPAGEEMALRTGPATAEGPESQTPSEPNAASPLDSALADPRPDSGAKPDHRGPELLASQPAGNEAGLGVSSAPSAGGETVVGLQPEAPPVRRLLVLVTSEPAPSPLVVTQAPEDVPSYARAVALRPDANGGSTWTQATASSDGTDTKLALVMLGSNPWQWGEED